jgi:SAM-dependent methyltransferase
MDLIESGILKCVQCEKEYEIIKGIPRFVSADNYAKGFGFQWTKHSKTQYDSFNGTKISQTRFFKETKWPRELKGEVIFEVGSGSGRFTEQAASTGAMVVSMDYSNAVDANYASNGDKNNVLIVQGDIYKMPFRGNYFDRLFCFGVLQHTPNVQESFMSLPAYLKPGGSLAVDVYAYNLKKIISFKYLTRWLVKSIQTEKLYEMISSYINFVWPLAKIINKIPYFGVRINWKFLLVADYRGLLPLTEEMLKEWAILDTFDMLSPVHDHPQSIRTLRNWFQSADLIDIDIEYGYGGIEVRGRKKT